MAASGINKNDLSGFEEILNLQSQGITLSDMQMRSFNDYVERRLSAGGRMPQDIAQDFSQQLPLQLPPQQQMISDVNMPFQNQQSFQTGLGDTSWPLSTPVNDSFSHGQSFSPTSRRRSSMAMFSNFVNDLGYNNDVSMERRRMEKRNSLDLLGDAAMAISNQEQMSTADTASNYMNMSALQAQAPRRSSLDFLINGDASLGRRNSLTHLLAQEFMNPSRRSSMATGTLNKPIDPFYMENLFEDQAKLAAGLGLGNPTAAAPDMLTLQLLQQKTAEEETALSNVEDYIKLQKLQTSLRRKSLSNMFDEINIMQQMNQVQNNNSDLPSVPDMHSHTEASHLEQLFQQQHQQQKIEQKIPSEPEPEPEPEEEELPPFSKENIDSFQTSMDKSAKSQKEIQLWDKKMGLKRSHSATMTKTTRSRKNLRRILEKHMTIILKQEEKDEIPEGNTNVEVGIQREDNTGKAD